MSQAEDGRQAPLDGIKVLDLSRVLAGPWCSMTLADLGATVWKVESPEGGDETRRWQPPQVEGISTYYLSTNRNKHSIAIDLRHPEGRQIALDLAREADVVLENFRPDSLAKLGLDYDSLKAINPRLVVCSISGYGRDNAFAERPGYDFVLQAETGFMSITGEVDGPPMRLGVAFIDLATGMNATQAILAALFMRERTGRGQHLDISLQHAGVQFLANVASGQLNTGQTPARHGNAHPSIVPYQLFHCCDGYLALAVGNDKQFQQLCQVLAVPWASDPRFASNRERVAHRETLIPMLEQAFSTWALTPLLEALHERKVPAGRVYSVTEALQSPESKARQVVGALPHDTLGQVTLVNSPMRFSDAKTRFEHAPPHLGEHSANILKQVLGWHDTEIEEAQQNGVIHCHPSAEENSPNAAQ